MANIQDVIGTLLQNLSEARNSADNISKVLSEQYRNDPILRLFPVPRTEIRDVEIELKFGVRSLQPRTDVEANKKARREAAIKSAASGFVKELAREAERSGKGDEDFKVISERLDSVSFRDSLERSITSKLSDTLVVDGDISEVDPKVLTNAFDISDQLSGALVRKNIFDFNIVRDEQGKYDYVVSDSTNNLEFRNDTSFDSEKEALDAALALIDKGTVKANYHIEKLSTEGGGKGEVQVVVRDGRRILARSDVIKVANREVSDADIESTKTDFIDNSGLIMHLRSVKRTNKFREISARGKVEASDIVDISSVIQKTVERVAPELRAELAKINEGVYDFEIDAAVDAETMAALPENAISSIRINAGIKNLNWTEIIRSDGSSSTKLIEE